MGVRIGKRGAVMRWKHRSGGGIASVLAILIALGAGQAVSAAEASVSPSPDISTSVTPPDVIATPTPDPAPTPTPGPEVTPTPTPDPVLPPSVFPIPFDLFVRVVQPDSRDERGWRFLEGWRIDAAFEGVVIDSAQPVTEALQEGGIAEAGWVLEAQEPTIGAILTAIPHRGYRPLRATCGHGSEFEDDLPMSITFEGNTIAFTDEIESQLDVFYCSFWYVGPSATSVGPTVPPTDTVANAQNPRPDGSGHLALRLLVGAVAAATLLARRRRREVR
jgi:hypothetical protein